MQLDENLRWVINQAEVPFKLLKLGEAEIAKENFCTAEDFFAEMDQLDDADNGKIDQRRKRLPSTHAPRDLLTADLTKNLHGGRMQRESMLGISKSHACRDWSGENNAFDKKIYVPNGTGPVVEG